MSANQQCNLRNLNYKVVSISKQCSMFDLSRSRLYYLPTSIVPLELGAIRILDELYLEDPCRGTRRMSKELKKHGFEFGRTKTRKLKQRMRLKTVYCRPRITIIDPAEYKYPYLLRILTIERVNQVWAIDITYVPMEKG